MACIIGMSSRTLRLLSTQLSMACVQFALATTKFHHSWNGEQQLLASTQQHGTTV